MPYPGVLWHKRVLIVPFMSYSISFGISKGASLKWPTAGAFAAPFGVIICCVKIGISVGWKQCQATPTKQDLSTAKVILRIFDKHPGPFLSQPFPIELHVLKRQFVCVYMSWQLHMTATSNTYSVSWNLGITLLLNMIPLS